MSNRSHWIIRAVLMISAIMILTLFSAAFEGILPVKHILIINSYTPDYPAYELYNDSLKIELNQNQKYKFSYSYEYLDIARYSNDKEYFELLAKHLKEKYAIHKPDFIVSDINAYKIFKKYGSETLADVPTIIEWNEDDSPLEPMPSNYIAIHRSIDIETNIQLILKTRPLTNTIHVVIGDSATERNVLRSVLDIQKKYADQVELVLMNKLSYAQMLEHIKSVEGDQSAILFVHWFTDIDGEAFVPAQVIQTICEGARAPVYATQIQHIGSGIVGGYVHDFERTGIAAANIVLDILEGEKPSGEPLTRSTTGIYAFDWRELKHWGIDYDKLPDRSKVEYRPVGVWALYGGYISATIALLTLQFLLILWLITNKKKRKKAEEELIQANASLRISYVNQESSEEKYRKLVDNIQEGVCIVQDEVIKFANEALTRITNCSMDETIGARFNQFVAPEDRKFFEKCYRLRQGGEKLPEEYEMQTIGRNQIARRTVIVNACIVIIDQRRATLITLKDITERKIMEEELRKSRDHLEEIVAERTRKLEEEVLERKNAEKLLEQMATHDHLTGLPNRKLFMERLDHAVELAKRSKSIVAVLFIDLDEFKEINDRFGHDKGDVVLKTVAYRLLDSVRNCDTVSRFGGDEFVIVIENIENVAEIDIICQRIIHAVGETAILDENMGKVTVSIGASIFPYHSEDINELIKKADDAMYNAKKSGKNKYLISSI